MEKMSRRIKWTKAFAILFIAFLFVALLKFKTNSIPPTFKSSNSNEIIAVLSNYLNKSGEKFSQKIDSQWWISDDGWNIYDQKAEAIIMNINPCGTENDCKVLNAYKNYAKLPKVVELNKKVSDVFIVNGFILNKKNTSKSLEDKRFYDYVLAFQKGEVRCTVTTSGDLYSLSQPDVWRIDYEIACSENFKKNYETETPYLRAAAAYSKNNKDAIVTPYAKDGNFETISLHFRRTGTSAVMKKVGDGYIELFQTQQQPSIEQCKILRENGAPPSYLKTCNY